MSSGNEGDGDTLVDHPDYWDGARESLRATAPSILFGVSRRSLDKAVRDRRAMAVSLWMDRGEEAAPEQESVDLTRLERSNRDAHPKVEDGGPLQPQGEVRMHLEPFSVKHMFREMHPWAGRATVVIEISAAAVAGLLLGAHEAQAAAVVASFALATIAFLLGFRSERQSRTSRERNRQRPEDDAPRGQH